MSRPRSPIAGKLLGVLPKRKQTGSVRATADRFHQIPLIDGTITWYHCRACDSFYRLIPESLKHPNLALMGLTVENVHGKYIEIDTCFSCSDAPMNNPRLVPVPMAS